MGNVSSIESVFNKLNRKIERVSEYKKLEFFDVFILPGVGSFDNAVNKLKELNIFDEIIRLYHNKKIIILGICLGMQLLTKKSQEGLLEGLALINAETQYFNFNDKILPHMGWNDFIYIREDSITRGFNKDTKFYFVHNYYVKCFNEDEILLKTNYGFDFCSGFKAERLIGVQFHPEKSHSYGLTFFNNFLEYVDAF